MHDPAQRQTRQRAAALLSSSPKSNFKGVRMDHRSDDNARSEFKMAIRALETQIASAGTHMTIDAQARAVYAREVRNMAEALRRDAESGRISWADAAEKAQQTRNFVMEAIRGRSTPIGRALATRLKAEGATLNEVLARQTVKLYGNGAVFAALNKSQQASVYSKVIASAGRSNPAVTAIMRKIGYAGRGLVMVSLAISIYSITTSANQTRAIEREVVVTGTGIGASIAGGALAGLACGPGAPVCVTLGAFVGGALGAFGAGLFW